MWPIDGFYTRTKSRSRRRPELPRRNKISHWKRDAFTESHKRLSIRDREGRTPASPKAFLARHSSKLLGKFFVILDFQSNLLPTREG